MNFAAMMKKRNVVETEESKVLKAHFDELFEIENGISRKESYEVAKQACLDYNKKVEKAGKFAFVIKSKDAHLVSGFINEFYGHSTTYRQKEGFDLLSGKTFEHKEKIKAVGGRWISDYKAWEIPSEHFEELYNLCNKE